VGQAADLPVVIAHRGACAVAPENTASAIREAIRLEVKVIEFDVRTTSDGALVLFHDDELKRITGKAGAIESLLLSDVAQLDVGTWFGDGSFAGEKIITLDEAIRLCAEGGVVPLIEHKSGSAADYAVIIKAADAAESVIVQSFDWKFLAELKNELPTTMLGALGSKKISSSQLESIQSLRPEWVAWKHSDLSASDLNLLKERGFKVALWTVNDIETAVKWTKRGVDGLITDLPGQIALGISQ
tara:strand:+ start:525 stop:1253 length:729 start_codon:yes stop_codon:yes gene_type:complete